MESLDIIAAIATPPGKGGIGVIRISGRNLQPLAKTILGKLPKPRYAHFSSFFDENGEITDQGIALYFPAPNSYTGEDVLELQGHGGPAILNLLLNNCINAGARLAQPGEFTLRAFLNNKIDLLQAESVADIIEASTDEAARCAVRSLQGEFSAAIHTLVESLIDLRMLIEATLDFPEEEIDFLTPQQVKVKLKTICNHLDDVLTSSRQGQLLQQGITIVLVGQPNVGKSSLINQLSGQDVAIVTEVPGTTRDTVHQTITLEGIPLRIIDTAGLRETNDIVERKGIERTHLAIESADIIIKLVDCRCPLNAGANEIFNTLPEKAAQLTVQNKIDLLGQEPKIEMSANDINIYLSAKTGAGISLLHQKLLEMAGWQLNNAGEGLFMARQRHIEALTNARIHLEKAFNLTEISYQLELIAEELRFSQQILSSITGQFTADDLLGEIFSRFCIGK